MPSKIKPWLMGLASTLMAVLRVQDSSIPYQGRLALILIDTVFETACFVYLRNELGWKLAQLGALADTKSRTQLFDTVRKTKTINPEIWDRIEECHRERNERAHFDPNKDIAEAFVRAYFDTAVRFINILFGASLDEPVLRLEGGLHPEAAPGASGAGGAVPAQIAEELARATHLYYFGDIVGAMNVATKVAKESDSPHAHYLLSLCLKKSGPAHQERAVEALERAIRREPLKNDPRVHLEYAALLLRINKAADSVRAVQAGFEIGLDSVRGRDAFGLYGDALRAMCRFADALNAYTMSLERDPTYPRGTEGLVETLLTVGADHEAGEAAEAAVARAPRNPYFHLLLARVRAAQKNFAEAFALLDEAWRLSTEKGGSGDNRVLLARASFLFAQYSDLPPASPQAPACLARVKREVLDALGSPTVRAGFRPAFRNFLVGILWREGDLEGAYQQALQGTRENKYQERNFAYLAAACLGTSRWEQAKVAAVRGVGLARQVVVWSIWCGFFEVIGRLFLDGAIPEVHELLKNWTARLATYPEFSPAKFDWFVVRKRLELSAETLAAPAKVLVLQGLQVLDAHP